MALHVEELIREIQRGNPEKLKAMLDFFSTKASRWSLNNLIALYVQKPYLERPITINEAKELGRYPVRGTKLACILVPVRPKCPDEEQNEEIQDDRIFFKAVPCVLDLATETQGKELLSYATAAEKVQAQKLYDLLKEVAQEQGFTVVDRSSFLEGAFGASGSFSRGGIIRVNSYASIENRTSTLVHEMAHALLHNGDPVYDTATKELHAETTAYLVLRHFGLPADYSAEYLQHWQATPKALMAQLKTITGASREIIHAVEKKLELQRTVDELCEQVSQSKLVPEKAVEELAQKTGRDFLINDKMTLAKALTAGEKEKILSRLQSRAPVERGKDASVFR
jgi:Zn-dependent peptidase ImmA (M78 family)